MKNNGKRFENEFKKSVPLEFWYYRFRDGTASYNRGENTRFQANNICDCQVMAYDKLYLFELKNTQGTSLPIGNIKNNQIEGLSEITHPKIKAYFIICFREKERCFGVEAKKVKEFIEEGTRKSIPLQWCIDNGIEIEMIKKKINYKYNLLKFFMEV